LNGDSEWRTKSRLALARAAVAYMMRPAPALATLLERPATLDRWDRLTAAARVIGLAGADAHGGVGTRAEDGTRSGIAGIPTYEAMFRTFSTRVVLDRRLSGDPASDGHAVFDAIRAGHVFTAIDALAGPALLDFHAEFEASVASPWNAWKGGRAEMGGYGPRDRRVTIVARAQKPVGSELVLLRDGKVVARSGTDTLRSEASNPGGAYRVEIRMTSAPGSPPIPWLVSNPIFFAPPTAAPTSRVREGVMTSASPVFVIPASAWRIEKDPGSSAVLRTANGQVELEYALKKGSRTSQYVALAADLPASVKFRAVRLRISADRPNRVSVQLRRADGARWGRSLFVDATPFETDEPVARLRPMESGQEGGTFDSASVKSVLLVVDLTNAGPGRSGILRLRSSALAN
jgi:hypothetical protein